MHIRMSFIWLHLLVYPFGTRGLNYITLLLSLLGRCLSGNGAVYVGRRSRRRTRRRIPMCIYMFSFIYIYYIYIYRFYYHLSYNNIYIYMCILWLCISIIPHYYYYYYYLLLFQGRGWARARPRPMCGGRGAVRPRGRRGRPPRAPQRGPSTWGGTGPGPGPWIIIMSSSNE